MSRSRGVGKRWAPRMLCAGWASMTLWSCSGGGTTTAPEEFREPPAVVIATLELSDLQGLPLPVPVRGGSGERLMICARARNPEGLDVTESLTAVVFGSTRPDVLQVTSSDSFVARFDGVLPGLTGPGLICALFGVGSPGVATITFTHVRNGQAGATATVIIRHRELG